MFFWVSPRNMGPVVSPLQQPQRGSTLGLRVSRAFAELPALICPRREDRERDSGHLYLSFLRCVLGAQGERVMGHRKGATRCY